jgi:hypothetical protein
MRAASVRGYRVPHPRRVTRRRSSSPEITLEERIWLSWSDDLANLETEARGRRTLEELWAASAHATSQSAVGAAEEIPLPPRSRRYTKVGYGLGSIRLCRSLAPAGWAGMRSNVVRARRRIAPGG